MKMCTLTSKDEEFVQVNSIETGIQRLATGSTLVESRYLFYGFDKEIRL